MKGGTQQGGRAKSRTGSSGAPAGFGLSRRWVSAPLAPHFLLQVPGAVAQLPFTFLFFCFTVFLFSPLLFINEGNL